MKKTVEIESGIVERAFLVGVSLQKSDKREAEKSLDELKQLVATLEIGCVEALLVPVKELKSRFLIGSGWAEEISQQAKEREADVIIFDEPLSPSQQKNWEALTGITVIDRYEVIIDIFSRRAATKEAEVQVELARLEYMLPRLSGAWTHLSRQRGGSKGTRGEGEKQLEMDRRLIKKRIDQLKRELTHIRRARAVKRQKREGIPIPTAAIIGYTNAGKSSLFNRLTCSSVLAENKLFATLDPTTRVLKFKGGGEILLTDTVGFVKKLPHSLIEAFRATLEEVLFADILIHVIDATEEDPFKIIEVTNSVLKEIGAADQPIMTLFNKVDKLTDHERFFIEETFPDSVSVSAKTGEGSEALFAALESNLSLLRLSESHYFEVPYSRYDLITLVRRRGRILSEEPHSSTLVIEAELPPKELALLKPFLRESSKG